MAVLQRSQPNPWESSGRQARTCATHALTSYRRTSWTGGPLEPDPRFRVSLLGHVCFRLQSNSPGNTTGLARGGGTQWVLVVLRESSGHLYITRTQRKVWAATAGPKQGTPGPTVAAGHEVDT